nr:serine protease 40-like [Drosophila takahashii]
MMSGALWIALGSLLLFHLGSAQFLEDVCGFYNPHNGGKFPPWSAEIGNASKKICSGTLINKRLFLFIVRLENSNYADNYVTKAYIHRSYSKGKNENTIGLLRLQREVEYSSHIQPICISTNPEDQTSESTFEKINEKPEIEGWCKFASFFGDACADKKIEKYLKSKFIGSPWNEIISDGPLLRYVQHGILSYRNPETYSDVYINVFAYIDWILERLSTSS